MEIRDKIMGCWLGKAVGGTLGQTFEGLEGPFEADYYLPVPTEMVPNDDLDLQVLYACVLREMANPVVDRHVLADAWRDHVAFPWNEYGVGQRNHAEGIEPPHTGSFDNWYTCGEGAAIRSELWACLAPGDPDLAAAYAYEDACFDHAGDGIWAAVFLARLESLAFVEDDPDTLLGRALEGIPSESGITRVVTDTRAWVAEGLDWKSVRARIMDRYGCSDFTDVRPNTGFVVLGWLAGTDFSERILICNNSGQDTDSSTASLGALLGILDPDCIEHRWLAPIGRDLVLNKEITGITPPPTIDGFTDLVLELTDRLGGAMPVATSGPFDPAEFALPVELAHTNTAYGKWAVRDQTELPPIGGEPPLLRASFSPGTLPGTWVRWGRDDFADNILLVKYAINPRGRDHVRLMFNCTEHFRIWLDRKFLFGAQGTQYMFPAPHMAPVGQSFDFDISDGDHELLVAIRKPPPVRDQAEWVIALVERPSNLWIPNAFRPTAS
ncbi:MAG: ADP-ribosylglycohydrolase family protein [Propionicimonas sp.]